MEQFFGTFCCCQQVFGRLAAVLGQSLLLHRERNCRQKSSLQETGVRVLTADLNLQEITTLLFVIINKLEKKNREGE